MQKRTRLLSFIAVIYMLSVHAMEIDIEIEKQKLSHVLPICDYGTLTEGIAHGIKQQQQTLQCPSFDSFSLQEMSAHFHDMSDDDKCNAIKHIPAYVCASKILSLLYGMVMLLPSEIIENHICLLMMDGENKSDLSQEQIDKQKEIVKNAATQLYTLSFLHAFDVYHEIKMAQLDDTQSIGSLYLTYLQKRDLVRELQSISSVVTRTKYDSWWKETVNSLDDDLKKTFLSNKNIFVLPGNELWLNLLITSGVTLSIGGVVCGSGAGYMSKFGGCSALLLEIGIGAPFIFCLLATGCVCVSKCCCEQRESIEKITIG